MSSRLNGTLVIHNKFNVLITHCKITKKMGYEKKSISFFYDLFYIVLDLQ